MISKMKNKQFIILIILVFLVLFLGYEFYPRDNIKAENKAPVVIKTQSLIIRPAITTVNAVGNLTSNKAIELSAKTNGYIKAILFRDGEQVKQGQVLIQLDSVAAKADVDAKRSALLLSQANYKRSKRLASGRYIAPETLDQLRADVEAAEAALAISQDNLSQTTITAPFSGIVGKSEVHVGQYISEGQNLVSLVNNEHIEVAYELPERVIHDLQAEQAVQVKAEAYPNQHFHGKVDFIAPSVNEASRTIAIKAWLDNHKGELLPGMFVQVKHVLKREPQAHFVPEQAVLADLNSHYIFIYDNGKVHKTQVALGQRLPGLVQITSDLGSKPMIVVAGQDRLKDGEQVALSQDMH